MRFGEKTVLIRLWRASDLLKFFWAAVIEGFLHRNNFMEATMAEKRDPSQQLHETQSTRVPRAFVIAAQHPQQSDADVRSSYVELERLANTLGIEVVHTEVQKRARTTSVSYLGAGKIEEIKGMLVEADVDMVLVDGELTPGQQRHLEKTLEVEVFDRTAVILRIFEQRAQTREAFLEIEIARLQYDMPRLRDDHSANIRQSGGGARGGRGHTSLELSKQQRRDRMAELRRELAEVQGVEAYRRERRRDKFQVSLVGYTNAGKSSLMRALTGSEVLVEDKLFATLGTTVRQLAPETTPRILISDTVGFIKNLPHELVASFRSTLDEAGDARFLLFVVDASDDDWRGQLALTKETLAAIGAAEIPSRVVLNKIDRLDEEAREALREELPDALQLSAHDPDDVAALREVLIAAQEEAMTLETLLIPYSKGQLLGEIRTQAQVVAEEYTEVGTEVRLRAWPSLLGKWQKEIRGY